MENPKYRVSMDFEGFKQKPRIDKQYRDFVYRKGKNEGKPISESAMLGSRIGRQIQELNIIQLASKISQGFTWSPHTFKECPMRKRRHRLENLWESTQIIGLDFDRGTSLEEIQNKFFEEGIKPCLIHKSFSWTPENNKYRALIAYDRPFETPTQVKKVILGLHEMFQDEEPDNSCKDLARIFYGGKPEATVFIDPQAVNSTSAALAIFEDILVDQGNHTSGSRPCSDFSRESGDGKAQKVRLANLSVENPRRYRYLIKLVTGILKDIQEYSGPDNHKGHSHRMYESRYMLLFHSARKLGQQPEIYPEAVSHWCTQAVEKNPYFDHWDYDASFVVGNAVNWASDKLIDVDELFTVD